MRELPILFNGQMVRAILGGRKTVTRRLIKPQPIDNTEIDGNFFDGLLRGYVKVDNHPHWRENFTNQFAKWQSGDTLWVKETFAPKEIHEEPPGQAYHYRADDEFVEVKWKPSIFMPRIASRITLEVERVELQRLYEISEADAIAEGVTIMDSISSKIQLYQSHKPWAKMEAAQLAYLQLWGEINGNTSVYENPWVWVIRFKVKA